MKVKICNPEKVLTLEDVTYLSLPSTMGPVGILDHHASMVILLKKGHIVFQPKGKLEITGGTAYVQPTETLILTDGELPNDL